MTVLCVLLALPLAIYMALVARPRARPVLVALVLTPLWASYLVKVYAWRILLADGGPLGGRRYAGLRLGRGGAHADLPVAAVHGPADLRRHRQHARVAPGGRGDLGARPWTAFRTWCCRCCVPGDRRRHDVHLLALARRLHHRAARRRHEPDARNLVYTNFSPDLPFAAAVALSPS